MEIYCCGCEKKVKTRLTDGSEIYPHRPDLKKIPFWKCDICGNYVGCHHKTKNRTQPLGCIPTNEIKQARMKIHSAIDPIWKSGEMKRNEIYKIIGDRIGRKYHTANIRSVEEAEVVMKIVDEIKAVSFT